MFIALFIIARMWMEKQYIYIYIYIYICTIKYYSASRRQEILRFTKTWINLEDTMLNEISQSQKEKYYMIPLMWGS